MEFQYIYIYTIPLILVSESLVSDIYKTFLVLEMCKILK